MEATVCAIKELTAGLAKLPLAAPADDFVRKLLAEMQQHDPATFDQNKSATFALGEFLDTLSSPGRYPLLLMACDRMIAGGYRDPIIAASAAQALVDLRNGEHAGPRVAIDLLDRYAPKDGAASPNQAAALGMRGRAYKDQFLEALSRNATVDATDYGHASLKAYTQAFEMADKYPDDPRSWLWRWPLLNMISVGHRLREKKLIGNLALSTEGVSFDRWLDLTADELRSRLVPRVKLQDDEVDPWDLAALAEYEYLFGSGARSAIGLLAQYWTILDKRENTAPGSTAFKRLGTLRQWSKLTNSSAQDASIGAAIRQGARLSIIKLAGSELDLDEDFLGDSERNLSDEARKVRREFVEAYVGDGQFVDFGLIDRISSVSKSVAALVTDDGIRFASGFAARLGDIFPEKCDDAESTVLITNAHAVGWGESAWPDSIRPNAAHACFERWNPGIKFRLAPLWSAGKPPSAQNPWFDVSILKLEHRPEVPNNEDCGQFPPPLKLFDENSEHIQRSGTAYLIGHPNKRPQQVSIGNNSIIDPPQSCEDIDKLVFYSTRTDYGSSGSPVLMDLNNTLTVVALHIGRAVEHYVQANRGAAIVAIRRELSRIQSR